MSRRNTKGYPRRRVANRAVVRSIVHNNMYRFESKGINGPVDPPKTSNDILLKKIVRITANVPQTGSLNITPALVLASLNLSTGGLHMRFLKVSVWSQQFSTNSVVGSDSEPLTVLIPGSGTAGSFPGGDGATFTDNGTFGARRPGVHVALPSLMASQWVIPSGAGEPDLIAQISITGDEASGTAVVVHVSCEIRNTARVS